MLFRRKKQASKWSWPRMKAGEVDAMLAGNTGALLAAGFIVGSCIKGGGTPWIDVHTSRLMVAGKDMLDPRC